MKDWRPQATRILMSGILLTLTWLSLMGTTRAQDKEERDENGELLVVLDAHAHLAAEILLDSESACGPIADSPVPQEAIVLWEITDSSCDEQAFDTTILHGHWCETAQCGGIAGDCIYPKSLGSMYRIYVTSDDTSYLISPDGTIANISAVALEDSPYNWACRVILASRDDFNTYEVVAVAGGQFHTYPTGCDDCFGSIFTRIPHNPR
ncbi:MAG: hypothetical protein GY722_21745 [bacterium]|nr:hypothetical protein [bacterium]